MKKIIALSTAAVLTLGSITGCSAAEASQVQANNSTTANNDNLKVVTTIFPEYDWVKTILGEKAESTELTMLLDNGVDLHSYQPTAQDILKIATCDLFIYVGGESDEWVEDALAEATNKDMIVIDLLDVLGDRVKAEEVVEGMEAEHDHEHEEGEEHEHEEGDEHEHEEGDEHEEEEEELDEHVWLSLRNTEILCEAITEALVTLDTNSADIYQSNLSAYKAELEALDQEYAEAVNNASVKTILFGDRFPFRYLVDDYGLSYYAAFVGCSAETEASFETITFLAAKVDELSLPAVMTIEGTDHRIAETIISATESGGQQILSMDSMQSTTSRDVADGATYLSIMRDNLEVLRQAIQ